MPNARELLAFLRSKGYAESRQTGSHVIFKNSDGKTLVVPVHRGKDLPKGLFLRILKDAGFTLEDFRKG
jgi:predicted RNA binding protein YcfA (HicA-like mRNA interferase family)